MVPDDPNGIVYVHNEKKGISLPNNPDQIFAIVNIKGSQFKVARGDRVLIEDLGQQFQVGQQVILDDVLMIGTPGYSSIGRPKVEKAAVYATLEEMSRSEKVIVFKKKRRQGYQKS